MKVQVKLDANICWAMQVLDRVLGEVSSNIGPLLEITSGSESSLQSFNFLGNSLLSEVDEAIAENMPGDAAVLQILDGQK